MEGGGARGWALGRPAGTQLPSVASTGPEPPEFASEAVGSRLDRPLLPGAPCPAACGFLGTRRRETNVTVRVGSRALQAGPGGRGALTRFSASLSADLLLLAGLASSVFFVSELLKLCERYFSAARKGPKDAKDGSPRPGP